MIKTHKKFTLKELENMTWIKFKKMINGIYPLEACEFEFPKGVKFEVTVKNLDLQGIPGENIEFVSCDNFNVAIEKYLYFHSLYLDLDIPCYIDLTVFYPGINDKGMFANTLMFDYIY